MHPHSTQLPLPLETEEWRPAPDYEDRYEISDVGAVRSLGRDRGRFAGHILTCRRNGKGYAAVQLWRGGRRKMVGIHRLVARAFLGEPLPYQEVNHRDGNKMNPAAGNLEWVTSSGNRRHAFVTGLQRSPYSDCPPPNAKLTEAAVQEIRLAGESNHALARRYGVSRRTIIATRQRKIWAWVK